MNEKDLPYGDLTLDQALAVFRQTNGLDGKYRSMSAEAQNHFERHDIIHVLFGLDTSLSHEAKADGWTLVGSDITWSDISAFMKLPEEQELIEEVGLLSIVKGYFGSLPAFARIIWRARRLHKKWRWADNAQYRRQNVADIRREFGIDRALAA